MLQARNWSWQAQLMAAMFATIILLFLSMSPAWALTNEEVEVGDKVEADSMMSSSPQYQNWRKATITKILMWQGSVSGIVITYDDDDAAYEHTTASSFLRKVSAAKKNKPEKDAEPARKQAPPPVEEVPEDDEGDVVEDDSEEAVKQDQDQPPRDMPAKAGAKSKVACTFNKNYKKVSQKTKPSAELFQSVIFEWQKSINKYNDFGLEFSDFKMGSSYKNSARAYGNKDVSGAEVGAKIYPLKTKLITCEKDFDRTYRTEWINEYACYKNRFDEWACGNGAPQNYKRDSFPNK